MKSGVRSTRDERAFRSRMYAPIATATRGVSSAKVLTMPKGRLAREKSLVGGMQSQEVGILASDSACDWVGAA